MLFIIIYLFCQKIMIKCYIDIMVVLLLLYSYAFPLLSHMLRKFFYKIWNILAPCIYSDLSWVKNKLCKSMCQFITKEFQIYLKEEYNFLIKWPCFLSSLSCESRGLDTWFSASSIPPTLSLSPHCFAVAHSSAPFRERQASPLLCSVRLVIMVYMSCSQLLVYSDAFPRD